MFDEYIELGPTPADEDCAQVGQPNYNTFARMEAKAYINQLNREFSHWVESGWIRFDNKWFNHDFGSYCEVVVYYQSDDEVSRGCAFSIDRHHAYRWDQEAKKELMEAGYWA